jgi:hypothetical protein
LFGCYLLFDISENLSHVFLESFIVGEYFLNNCSCYYNNFSFGGFVGYKIINIGFDLIESYSIKITNNIDYFGNFGTKQIGIKKGINIY